MASIRFRSNKWQARVSRKGEQSLVKTFQSKEDAQRWARSIEVEWDKGTYQNTHQAQKTSFGELIERYLREVTPLMRGAKADTFRLKANMKKPVVGFIAGVTAPPGKRMGHAGALISGGADTADAKLAVMEECGFKVTRNPSEMAALLKAML